MYKEIPRIDQEGIKKVKYAWAISHPLGDAAMNDVLRDYNRYLKDNIGEGYFMTSEGKVRIPKSIDANCFSGRDISDFHYGFPYSCEDTLGRMTLEAIVLKKRN